ncbi:H-NS family histone-like protein [Pasteurella testudinis]|uniref:H-NS family histone-like protein n=1 Tax=Pasteurella testudinis TaxID=761 RepID=UPI004059B235
MSELIKKLSNLRSLRVLTKELSVEQLEEIVAKFVGVIEEKKEALLASRKQEEERLQKIASVKAQIENSGLSKEELAALLLNDTAAATRKKRAPRPAKYHYTDENGVQKTWTGQGRTPKAIQDALDNGKSLSDFEI